MFESPPVVIDYTAISTSVEFGTSISSEDFGQEKPRDSFSPHP